MMQAAQAEARLAVRLYNDAAEERAFEGFVVHMQLAWLYLLHAEFTRDGVDYRYRRRDNSRLIEYIDGEPKCWELSKCVSYKWDAGEPVRQNIEFFIQIRNRIEHRYQSEQRQISLAVSGHAQALLLNFEEELVDQFGENSSLATTLRFPVFIGSFTDSGKRALNKLRSRLPAPLRKFISEYHADLDSDIRDSSHFEFRIRLVSELTRATDDEVLPMQFTRYDEMSEEQRVAIKDMGVVIVREQRRSVSNDDLYKPRVAAEKISESLIFVFNQNHFTKAWKALGVRPETGNPHPERTKEQYCRYDSMHKDYGYTDAFIKAVIKRCSSADGFLELIGVMPRGATINDPVGDFLVNRSDG
ncbi:DUF3644 domain-containing protein [Streptosporangium sp. 'caverna']|uniref:DUF3644 domain-containing protein n=1 Tax=Streptosporangium sp. 'caverna' TaxID=2202249 RepID=UPI0013A6A401|nr:DUF3644 domain-containing protein [Streptosporangium sp. 'caverna']